MKRYLTYLFVYSVGGFVLERIINLIFLGYWHDNSVLIGPYQPLYGNGVVLTILFFEFGWPKIKGQTWLRHGIFILIAILATALSEATTGIFYEAITGITLWDYNQTFTCSYPYVCVLPTSLFGVLSYAVVYWLHPYLKRLLDNVPNWLFYPVLAIVTIDVIYTGYHLISRYLLIVTIGS
jgi:uncharacterized membrane protein